MPIAIEYVGSASGSSSPTANTVVTLPGGMVANDLILVAGCVADTVDNALAAPSTGGYTEVLTKQYQNDVNDIDLTVFYKFHNGTDTNITFTNVGGTNASNAAVCMVFRNVKLVADGGPFATTSQSTGGISTSNADPSSIATATGDAVVIVGATGHTGTATATYTFPANYTTNAVQKAHNDTIDALIGMGYRLSGYANPENPGAFTAATIGVDADNAWAAFTMALAVRSVGTTTVTKEIGSTGTYSTPQLWEDSMGTDHTTAERMAAGTFSGNLTLGETLTWTTGGATAKLLDTDNSAYITYAIIAGAPTSGTVTGGTSLKTCNATSAYPTHIGVLYVGQCQNQEFTGANPLLTLSGTTTSTTTPITLTTKASASFVDNANKLTNALRYNASNGAAIRGTSLNDKTIIVTSGNVTVSKLQIANDVSGTAAGAIGPVSGGANFLLDSCIAEANHTGTSTSTGVVNANTSTTILYNCLIVQKASAADHIVGMGGSAPVLRNCTLVASDDLATAPTMIFAATAAVATITNCALFAGDSTKSIVSGGAAPSFTTCYSDISGTAGVTQTTYGNAFENVNNATRDFRLKTGSALIDTGTTDGAIPDDIVGTSRPLGAFYDVGAWEFTPVSAGANTGFQYLEGGYVTYKVGLHGIMAGKGTN